MIAFLIITAFIIVIMECGPETAPVPKELGNGE